ncbi:hypothetical protein EON82_25795, partial [bacterium]
QMERIASNPDVRFVFQWKQVRNVGGNSSPLFSGTRRYVAKQDTGSGIASTLVEDLGNTVDMGDPDALRDFVAWGKTNYPSDHYALVLWNHGAGWMPTRGVRPPVRGISYDEDTGSYMDPWEVSQGLAGQKVDILAYDACLMQGAEDLLELSSHADYIVGSEENTPGPGYPYHTVFKPFVDSPDRAVPDLAKSLVTAFHTFYASGTYSDWALHHSVLDCSQVPAFQFALDNFALSLTNNSIGTLMNDVRNASTLIAPIDGYRYYDLDQIAEKTASLSTVPAVTTTANALRTAIANMTVLSQSNTEGAHMRGVSIEFSRSNRFNGYASDYANLRLSTLTHWDDFLSNPTANP